MLQNNNWCEITANYLKFESSPEAVTIRVLNHVDLFSFIFLAQGRCLLFIS